jgi:hypothetical protein
LYRPGQAAVKNKGNPPLFFLYLDRRSHVYFQLLLGYASLETTMVYTHVAWQGVAGEPSPLDALGELTAEEVQAALDATRRLAGE